MPTIARLFADSDGARITDTDGYLITIEGDVGETEPPKAPTGLVYNRTTGALTVDAHPDAAEYRFYGNDRVSGPRGLRTRLVASSSGPTASDGALAAGQYRTYDCAAYDDYSGIEGPPCPPVYAPSDDRRP